LGSVRQHQPLSYINPLPYLLDFGSRKEDNSATAGLTLRRWAVRLFLWAHPHRPRTIIVQGDPN